jgi:hypothetical protein
MTAIGAAMRQFLAEKPVIDDPMEFGRGSA